MGFDSGAVTPGYIEGWIFDTQEGNPLPEANVILVESLDSQSVITTVKSGPDGNYKFNPTEPGLKHLFVWAPDFASKRQTILLASENKTVNHLLFKAARIIGSVTNESNEPIRGAEIVLEYLDRHDFPFSPDIVNGPARSNVEGHFLFRTVQPLERIRITATSPDYQTYVSQILILGVNDTLTLRIVLLR
jgi:hypothetical protein